MNFLSVSSSSNFANLAATGSTKEEDAKLSPELLSHLNKNFVVYDPLTRKFSQNFKRLLTSKVWCLGSFHDSYRLLKVHAQLIKLASSEKQSSAVLLEVLPPGTSIKSTEVPVWNKYLLESTLVVGSDIRFECSAEEYMRYMEVETENEKICLERRKALKKTGPITAKIFNEALIKGLAKVNDQIFSTYESVLNEFINVKPHYSESLAVRCAALSKKRVGLDLREKSHAYQLFRSNQGLVEQVEKMASKCERMYAIWGLVHFKNDPLLKRTLEERGISSVILLPNKKLQEKVLDELMWRNLPLKGAQLSVRTEQRSVYLGIPPYVQELLDARIQACLSKEKEGGPSPIVFDFDSLPKLINEDAIVLPANTPIHFVGANSADLEMLTELQYEAVESHRKRKIMEHLTSCIRNFLMLRGYGLEELSRKDVTVSTDFLVAEPTMIYKDTSPIMIKVTKKRLSGSPTYLFAEMYRQKMSKFAVTAGELCFDELDAKELERLLSDPEKLVPEWLSKKTPKVSQKVALEGKITYAKTENSQLVLRAENGFTIEIKDSSSSKDDDDDEKEDDKL